MAGWKRARRINTYYRRLCFVHGLSILTSRDGNAGYGYSFENYRTGSSALFCLPLKVYRILDARCIVRWANGIVSLPNERPFARRRVQVVFATIYGGQFWNIVRSQAGHCAVSNRKNVGCIIALCSISDVSMISNGSDELITRRLTKCFKLKRLFIHMFILKISQEQ